MNLRDVLEALDETHAYHAVFSFILLLAFIFAAFVLNNDASGKFGELIFLVFGFWFGSRVTSTKSNQPTQST